MHFQCGVADSGACWPDHPIQSKGPMKKGLYPVSFDTPFPPGTKPTVSVGLSHLDVDKSANTRIKVYAYDITHEGFWMSFDTWGDTKIWGVSASWVALVSPGDKHVSCKWSHGAWPNNGLRHNALNTKKLPDLTALYPQAVPNANFVPNVNLLFMPALTVIDQDKPTRGHPQGLRLLPEKNEMGVRVAQSPGQVWTAGADILVGAMLPHVKSGVTELHKVNSEIFQQRIDLGDTFLPGTVEAAVFLVGYELNDDNIRIKLTHRTRPDGIGKICLDVTGRSWAGTTISSVHAAWIASGLPRS